MPAACNSYGKREIVVPLRSFVYEKRGEIVHQRKRVYPHREKRQKGT